MQSPVTVDQISRAGAHATATGALVPVEVERHPLRDGDLPYEITWVSSLNLKEMARAIQAESPEQHNPFLPFEQDLHVADISSSHVMILNKFAISADHTLIITRDFESQAAAITDADFAAIAPQLAFLGGMFMFNGGAVAGASQPHKHFHLMRDRQAPLSDLFTELVAGDDLLRVPRFNFLHALARLDLQSSHSPQAQVARMAGVTRRCLEECRLHPSPTGEMPPYNLLATPEWLLLVPRSRAVWSRGDLTIQVHGMNFGGMVFVGSDSQLDAAMSAGLLPMLEATTLPPDGGNRDP